MSPPSSTEDSDKIFHTQKETSGTMLNCLLTAPSMTEEQKKLQSLEEKIDILEILRIASMTSFVLLTISTILSLCLPIKFLGIPFYSFILGFHSLSLATFSIVQYHFISPLIDEHNIISYKIAAETTYPPVHHPSKKEMRWRYVRLFVIFVCDAGIWKSLSYIELPHNLKDMNEKNKGMFICFLFGWSLIPLSFLVLFLRGPITVEPEIIRYKSEEGEEDTDKKIPFTGS